MGGLRIGMNQKLREAFARCPEAAAALEKLKAGNARFVAGKTQELPRDSARRESLAREGQYPYAFLLTCSDSRVVPEFIFSAGLGELFVTRAAGNVLGTSILASAQYAAQDLGAKLFVVLGHSQCGGVKATLSGEELSGALAHMGQRIRAGIGRETDYLRAVELNARAEAADLAARLLEYCPEQTLVVVPAVYDIETGSVRFLED